MKYRNIVVLTGAGISAESGIKTFRASDGLWEDHPIEDVATFEGFMRNLELVHQFYNNRRKRLLSLEVMPNAAHIALGEFERKLENFSFGKVWVVTQNIDNLHERGGTKNLIHMHGELLKARCMNSNKIYDWKKDMNAKTFCDCCGEYGVLRPHVVWFGEMPLRMNEIEKKISECDLFLSIGTSGNVYPAAGFVDLANRNGAYTVEINLEVSDRTNAFARSIQGKASETVPVYLESLLK